jgi:hypothetical protein
MYGTIKVDGSFLEESQITICDGLKVCIELCEQIVRVALRNHSGLGFYGQERHVRVPAGTEGAPANCSWVTDGDHEAHFSCFPIW